MQHRDYATDQYDSDPESPANDLQSPAVKTEVPAPAAKFDVNYRLASVTAQLEQAEETIQDLRDEAMGEEL